MSLADELGSGMRNTYKYIKLYSGGMPEFIEGEVFKTIIPLSSAATSMIGPETQDRTQDRADDQTDIFEQILEFCVEPKSKKEIMDFIGRKSTKRFTQNYLKPLLDGNKLKMTEPDKITSKNQKYVTNKIEAEI